MKKKKRSSSRKRTAAGALPAPAGAVVYAEAAVALKLICRLTC